MDHFRLAKLPSQGRGTYLYPRCSGQVCFGKFHRVQKYVSPCSPHFVYQLLICPARYVFLHENALAAGVSNEPSNMVISNIAVQNISVSSPWILRL